MEEYLAELESLALTAGAEVVERITFQVDKVAASMFIGKGKAAHLARLVDENELNLVIFDAELSPSQEQNLEGEIGARIIDRPALILDIFAQRALSSEGKIKVELAQLKRLKTRLTGSRRDLSRLGGGIGTRGPGEMKLEADRRKIGTRISRLNKKLADVARARQTQRDRRERAGVPLISLTGYTNSGKSTLINTLTGSREPTEDKLFATLDPASRKLVLPDGKQAIISDTVGIIRDMPKTLWDAFKATFEEVEASDIILHVINISDPSAMGKEKAGQEMMEKLKINLRPVIVVYNKIDLLPGRGRSLIGRGFPDMAYISAKNGLGVNTLLDAISVQLRRLAVTLSLLLPYGYKSEFIESIYSEGVVHEREDLPEGVRMIASVPAKLFGKLDKAGIKWKKIELDEIAQGGEGQ